MSHDLADEIVFSLLETFAHCVTGETNDGNVAVLFEVLSNREVGILDENLFCEANLFVELVDSSDEHLFDDCFGLFAIFVHSLSFEDFFFVFDFGLRHFVACYILRICSCDLQSDVVNDFTACALACFDHNADFATHVDISVDNGVFAS